MCVQFNKRFIFVYNQSMRVRLVIAVLFCRIFENTAIAFIFYTSDGVFAVLPYQLYTLIIWRPSMGGSIYAPR